MSERVPDEYIAFRKTDNGSTIPIDIRNGKATGEAGKAIRLEHKQRIAKWTSPEVISLASGLSRQQIYEKYGNTPEPIACIHKKYLKYFSEHTEDTTIYCGMGYFVDHIVNHHSELPVEAYQNIQDIFDNPDEVIRDDRIDNRTGKKRDNLIFVKNYNKKHALVISLIDNGNHIIFHKTFHYIKENPYPSLTRIGNSTSEDVQLSIGTPTCVVRGGGRISARDVACDAITIQIILENVQPYVPILDTKYTGVFAGLNRIRH